MSGPGAVNWRQIDTVLHRTGAVSDCIGRPGILEVEKSTYEQLLQSSHDYYKLRQALIAGGVNDEALDTLIQGYQTDVTTATEEIWSRSTENWVSYPNVPFITKSPHSFRHASFYDRNIRRFQMLDPPPSPQFRYESHVDVDSSAGEMVDDRANFDLERPGMFASKNQRTLTFSNLPSNATLKDVTNVIKGGRLIELRLRSRERKAIVIFAEGAAEYFAWAHSNDIYIGAKRIEVSWADHQPHVHRQIPAKLANGHTRNLVLQGAGKRITGEAIRNDLEHIDKLVIIDITATDREIVISTNSVNLAGYARSCMTSRAKYKGISISWFPDSCAHPLPIRQCVPRVAMSSLGKPLPPRPSNVTNRFKALEVADETDIASEAELSDDDSATSGIDLKPRSTGTASV